MNHKTTQGANRADSQDAGKAKQSVLTKSLPRWRDVENWLYKALGEEWLGNTMMPLGGNHTLHFHEDGVEYVASFIEDAHDIGFGYPDEWKLIIHRKSLHKVMRWYLWNWAYRDWFGVRRWLWYKLLHRIVQRHVRVNGRSV